MTSPVNNIVASPTFAIRRLRVEDADNLAHFYNRLSQSSKRTFRPSGPITITEKCVEIANANIKFGATHSKKYDLVALYDEGVIGWGFLWDLDSGSPTFGLAVADTYHHRGIGSLLISKIMEWAREIALAEVQLTVVQDNEVAWRLYMAHGFVKTGSFTGDDGLPYFRMIAKL